MPEPEVIDKLQQSPRDEQRGPVAHDIGPDVYRIAHVARQQQTADGHQRQTPENHSCASTCAHSCSFLTSESCRGAWKYSMTFARPMTIRMTGHIFPNRKTPGYMLFNRKRIPITISKSGPST